ncbi:hypothetical protein N7470_001022 [Penicillium chermesinum]|nr:hypothetical protein N7470_001022 [Penicillium chermesinum]
MEDLKEQSASRLEDSAPPLQPELLVPLSFQHGGHDITSSGPGLPRLTLAFATACLGGSVIAGLGANVVERKQRKRWLVQMPTESARSGT